MERIKNKTEMTGRFLTVKSNKPCNHLPRYFNCYVNQDPMLQLMKNVETWKIDIFVKIQGKPEKLRFVELVNLVIEKVCF